MDDLAPPSPSPFVCISFHNRRLPLAALMEQIVFNLDPKSQTIMNDKGSRRSRKKLVGRQRPLAPRGNNCLPSVQQIGERMGKH